MNEKPILFNSEMVNAILSGRKTQTRRIIKLPLIDKNMGCELAGNELAGEVAAGDYRNCPLGKPGVQLWVRETWARYNIDQTTHDMAYRATTPTDWPKDGLWRPSIHMPRWASRINLLITGVRVERLNDISEQDAQAEGCAYGKGNGEIDLAVRPENHFPTLWASIYGAESWQANPWVWVIEFERMEAK
ncbi:morphogenetic protein [Yersinia canariae]|uniref:morphogenetic protein n=1 Tax=Yersinia canariae TaxID=2607663 RepID=UPI00119E54F7|nr:morphogenetic protein [Yersinia canariae]